MAIIRKIDQALFRVVSIVTQVLMLSAVFAGFYQVLARFVLQSPADWSEAWTRAALIWTVMLGISLAFRHGAMLSVEVLRGRLRGANRRRLEHIIMAITVAFLGYMAWIGGQMTYRVRFQTMPSLEFSISWIYISIPLGAALAIIAVLAHWAEGTPDPGVDETTI